MRRIHARVEGRVQGVGFRYHATDRALRLKLTGWVRNLPDGSVELEAQGKEGEVSRFLEYLREGPPSARVSRVHVDERATQPGEARFQIR